MSLSRAFTTRRANRSTDLGDSIKRSNTLHKTSSQQPLRHKISAPVQLVHTTNMLSYNAPDIHPQRPSRSDSGATRSTIDESDAATTITAESTPPTSPDGEAEYCPPHANHLSSYFVAPGTAVMHGPSPDAPAIPKRSPSHTKKNSFDALARKRSMSRVSQGSDQSNPGLTFSRSSSTSTRTSTTSQSSVPHTSKLTPPPIPHQASTAPPVSHVPSKSGSSPFGQELAQVTELAEEFGAKGRLELIHEDEQYLRNRGLIQMTADDYLNEVHELMATFWPQAHAQPEAPMWI